MAARDEEHSLAPVHLMAADTRLAQVVAKRRHSSSARRRPFHVEPRDRWVRGYATSSGPRPQSPNQSQTSCGAAPVVRTVRFGRAGTVHLPRATPRAFGRHADRPSVDRAAAQSRAARRWTTGKHERDGARRRRPCRGTQRRTERTRHPVPPCRRRHGRSVHTRAPPRAMTPGVRRGRWGPGCRFCWRGADDPRPPLGPAVSSTPDARRGWPPVTPSSRFSRKGPVRLVPAVAQSALPTVSTPCRPSIRGDPGLR